MRRKCFINGIKIALFSILVCGMLISILKVFNYKSTGGGGGFQHLYGMDKDTIEVMFFGSSHAHCTIDHGYLWEEYGIAGYTLSAGAQQLDSTYYFIKEALRVHNPKVIAVEMYGVTGGEINNAETEIYRNTLPMRWSPVFHEYVSYMSENMDMDKTWKQQVYTKIPIIHSRYAEAERSDFKDNVPFMMGYRGSYEVVPFEEPNVVLEKAEIGREKEKWLQKIVDVAAENDVQVVFFAAPYVVDAESQKQYNAIEDFAAEKGIVYINYNKLYDEIGLDFETDFRDSGHLNNYGSVKVTGHMADFLKENYELEDKRGQSNYALWDENALYLRNKELRNELLDSADINEYLQKLAEVGDEQIIILALNGNYNALGEVYLDNLTKLGITPDEYTQGGVWIFKNRNRILYLPGKEYKECIKTRAGEISLQSSVYTAEDETIKENVQLLLNGEDYYQAENGVNIIVYNEGLNQLIDAAADDIYLGLELVHCEEPEE